MSDTVTAATALTKFARTASGGLVTGGGLGSRASDGDAARRVRRDILDADIHIDIDERGIGEVFSRAQLEG